MMDVTPATIRAEPGGTVPTMSEPTKTSPLHERHVALGAKLADFGGWQMPIEYPGGGVLREHTAVRERVGIFDVSHLGKALVKGEGAADFVNSCFTNDLRKIAPPKAQYTMCCDDETGGVVDDLIQYFTAEDEVFLVPNAANTAEVIRRMQAKAPAASRSPTSTRTTRSSRCKARSPSRLSRRSGCRRIWTTCPSRWRNGTAAR